MTPALDFVGEHLAVPERMVVAPATGVFTPAANCAPGTVVAAGDTLGEIAGPATRVAVTSPFHGTLMAVLAQPGERLRDAQPVAWLRSVA